MAHMTLPGQKPQSTHMQFPDFHARDGMPPYSQFSSEQVAKDFVPPDPLEMRPGMYIPPEETAAMTPMEPSLDDIMGWSQSDDEQQDTDDEDNEFDMEFDDPEGLPMAPVQSVNPMVCERHLSQPNFSALEASYQQQPLPVAYPIMTRYEYEQQPGYKAPFNFINPSSLQLKATDNSSRGHSPIIPTDAADTTLSEPALEPTLEPLVEPLVEPLPELEEPLDDDKTLGEIGLGMDMDFVFDDARAESEPLEPFSIPHLASPLNSPTLDGSKINTPKLASPSAEDEPVQDVKLHTPPTSAKEFPSPAPESPAVPSPVEDSAALSPPPEKPRKRTARRAPKSSAASHGAAHVCNMTFSDGKECHRSFTRPYDLARHQETIHAPVRRTYKCDACGYRSKTFSRLDALSRHVRLKHSG